MVWENLQLSKLETNYKNTCSEVFYRMTVLKISADSQKITCCGYGLVKFRPSFHNFVRLGPQHGFFTENVPTFSEELVLCNTSGKVFVNLQKILIVTTPYYPTCIW